MKNPFQRSYSSEELWIFDFLSEITLFRSLTNREKSLFLPYFYLRQYKQDEVVFFRGDPAHALYVIKKGKVELVLDVDQEFEKLGTVRNRQSFGNSALIPDADRQYTAIVRSPDADLYVIPHVNINDIFREESKVQAKMLRALATLYERHVARLYESYRSSKGFFSLEQIERVI